jgi:hypothetical protein
MRFTNLTRRTRTRALGALLLTMAVGVIAPAAQADAAYVIKPRHSMANNMCLDVQGGSQLDGARLIQWGCNNQANQRFNLVATDSGYFKIIGQGSGKCVDVKDGGTADFTPVQQWGCHVNAYHQQFLVRPTGDGYYNIVPRHVTGKCLDILGFSPSAGTPLILHGCRGAGGSNQQFSFQWVP